MKISKNIIKKIEKIRAKNENEKKYLNLVMETTYYLNSKQNKNIKRELIKKWTYLLKKFKKNDSKTEKNKRKIEKVKNWIFEEWLENLKDFKNDFNVSESSKKEFLKSIKKTLILNFEDGGKLPTKKSDFWIMINFNPNSSIYWVPAYLRIKGFFEDEVIYFNIKN